MAKTTAIEAEIWSRIIAPDEPNLGRHVAKVILTFSFTNEDRQRMASLAAKSREGNLSAKERAEAESYERVSNVLGILKSKARRSLRSQPPG